MNFKRLTKTPYLVLFIILLGVGVGTASALVTITLAGDVNITGDTAIGGELSVGTDSAIDTDFIRFDDGSKFLSWQEGGDEFLFNDRLRVFGLKTTEITTTGPVQVGIANPDDDDTILFDDGTEKIFWDESESQFEISDELLVDGNMRIDDSGGNEYLVLGDWSGSHLLLNLNGLDLGIGSEGDINLNPNGDVQIGASFPAAKLHALGGCIGCMDFYQKSHTSLSAGINDLSCDNGDQVINGGGWSTSTTHWIRESWALDTDTWRLSMTAVNGADVTPGAFKITCADMDPTD